MTQSAELIARGRTVRRGESRFESHHGIDERGVIRAFIANLASPGRPAGVHPAARMTANQTALMLGTGAVIMAGVGILISGNSSAIGTLVINSQNNVVAPPVSTVVSTSTTS